MVFNFDPPETGWDLNAYATIISDVTAPTQPKVLHLNCGGATSASCSRTITLATEPSLVPGNTYPVWAWVNFDGMTLPGLPVRFYYEGTGLDVLLNRQVDEFGDPVPDLGWELRFVGNWAYNFPDYKFYIIGLSVPGSLGTINVDEITIVATPAEVAVAGKWSAIAAATTVLKTINGTTDGFNTDLGNRVYSRLFFPSDTPDVKLPYVCFSLDQEGERISYEGFAFSSTWMMTGYAFFADNAESDMLDSSGSIAAALFRDDLIRAFMADQSLSATVLNCEVTAIETASGSISDPYSWVIFTVEFTQESGAADLAAS